jgi:hypothetical protein
MRLNYYEFPDTLTPHERFLAGSVNISSDSETPQWLIDAQNFSSRYAHDKSEHASC